MMRFRMMLMLGVMTAGGDALDAQTVISTEPFRSVELQNGGLVVVRYGPTQRVTLLQSDAGEADVGVEDGRLRISKCRTCRHDRRLRVEVVTPTLESVAVAHGGTMALEGRFPAQTRLVATVSNGGRIDARALNAEQVTASVEQGGGIWTRSSRQLDACVTQGGAITYWGEPTVRQNIEHGGAIVRGRAEDATRPMQELGAARAPVPPVPPIPPHPPGTHRL
jgi:hypothetical protein